jgi:hypothetical protein
MPVFYEHKQKGVRNWGYLLISLLSLAAISIILIGFTPGRTNELASMAFNNIAIPLFIVLFVSFFYGVVTPTLTIRIDDQNISIYFGGSIFRKHFALTEIASCQQVRIDWLYGYGVRGPFPCRCIRWTPSGWFYNVAGFDAVEIIFKNGKTVRLGTDEPEKLAAAIQSATKLYSHLRGSNRVFM